MSDRLQRVLDALRILSPTSFALGDEEPIELATRGLAPGELTPELVSATIQGHLYNQAYVREWPDGDPPLDPNVTPPPDPTFMARLNGLRPEQLIDLGWQVVSTAPDGSAHLAKNGWRRSAAPGAWGVERGGLAWVELSRLHPGPANTFAFLYGLTPGDGNDQGNLFRVYLHTCPEGGADVLQWLVHALDARRLPFTLKTLMAPAAAARADAAVLYASRRYHRAVLGCVREMPELLLHRLGPATPLFALPLRPGVAVAEDPPTGESFGMNRLRLTVEAVLDLWRRGTQDGTQRRRAVEARFAADGLRLDASHLGPGSTIRYAENLAVEPGEEPGGEPRRRQPSRPSARTAEQSSTEWDPLASAARVGAHLCREALWHGGACTWQGWAMMDTGDGDEFVWRAMGADLYRGTSGIALFLTRLWEYTGEGWLRDTALAGFRQALGSLDHLKPDVRMGLHTGLAGIGHAALDAGVRFERPDLVEAGLDVLAQIGDVELDPAMFDVVSGAAGCIPVLVAAASRHDRPSLLHLAVRLGDFLVQQSRPMEPGCAWGSHPEAGSPPLCGYSHGAGGVSWALAELHGATDERRFLEAARSGLEYERDHFRSDARNWLDLRVPAESPSALTAMAWCHGAPGIALSRLDLSRLLPDDEAIREELEIAVESTAQHLRSSDAERLPLGNVSLCHGAFGNADVVLLAARRLQRPDLEDLAQDVGRLGVVLFEARGVNWPTGNPSGLPTPGLMLGDAGAGHFFLRLHDPDGVPSPLRFGLGDDTA